MSRIYKGSETTLKLLVHSCDEGIVEDVKVYLYTHDPENAIEFTNDRITIEGDIVSLKTDKWTFNNQNEGVINYIAKCKVNGNVFVTERQSSYYLKATEDFNPTDTFRLEELNEVLEDITFSIKASERECAGFSAVTIDATQLAESKYQEGYEDGRPVLGDKSYDVTGNLDRIFASNENLDGYSAVTINATQYGNTKYESGYTSGYTQSSVDKVYDHIKAGEGTFEVPYSVGEAQKKAMPKEINSLGDEFYIIGRIMRKSLSIYDEEMTDEYKEVFKNSRSCRHYIETSDWQNWGGDSEFFIPDLWGHEMEPYVNRVVMFKARIFITLGKHYLLEVTNYPVEVTELSYLGSTEYVVDKDIAYVNTDGTFYDAYYSVKVNATQFGNTKYESGYTSGYESGYTSGYTVGYEDGESGGGKKPKIPNGLVFENSTWETFDMEPYDWSSHYYCDSLFANCKNLKRLENVPEDWKPYGNTGWMFHECRKLEEAPMLDLSCVGNTEYMFQYCTSLKTIPQYNMHFVENASSMFMGCAGLETLPALDFTNMKECNMFTKYGSSTTPPNLAYVGGFINVRCDLYLASVAYLEHDGLMNIINNLYDFTGNSILPSGGEANLTFNKRLDPFLSDEEKTIAVNKGWKIIFI